jgi:carbonic anhydrase
MIQHNDYLDLLKNNREWASEKLKTDPSYFKELALPQKPKFLVIGCSDSRVNLTDINLLSIIEYSVEILNIEHIIVLGHYKCGGVKAAVEGLDEEDIVENWVSQISDLYHFHRKELESMPDKGKMYDRLSEMNVVIQLKNLLRTPIIQRAFRKKKKLWFHGWIFDIHTGLITDLILPLDEWKEYDLLPEDYCLAK